MQNVIFPMRTINITQRALDSFSHKNLEAWDIAGADTGIESAYAPCRVKVLAKLPYETTGFSNTVFFGSCDKNGRGAVGHSLDDPQHGLGRRASADDAAEKSGIVVGIS